MNNALVNTQNFNLASLIPQSALAAMSGIADAADKSFGGGDVYTLAFVVVTLACVVTVLMLLYLISKWTSTLSPCDQMTTSYSTIHHLMMQKAVCKELC